MAVYMKEDNLKTDLLENISEAFGIFISELKQEKMQRRTISYILACSDYDPAEWNKLITYILGIKCDFKTEKEAKEFYVSQIIKLICRENG